MNPIRKPTIAGTTQIYEFKEMVTQFLVKNLSGGNVKVSLEPPGEGVSDWLIPNGAWQKIPGCDNHVFRRKVYVIADMTSAAASGVEIEAVEYRLSRG